MNKRIAKKKITRSTLCKLWLRNFIDNSKAFNNFGDLLKDKSLESPIFEMYYSGLCISINYIEFDLRQGYKVIQKYNIPEKLYIKVVYELIKNHKI